MALTPPWSAANSAVTSLLNPFTPTGANSTLITVNAEPGQGVGQQVVVAANDGDFTVIGAHVHADVLAEDIAVPDAFGVPSPPPEAPEATPRLVICPLLAFDRAGGRLGQGGGHYDRTLAVLRAQGPVFVLGRAYAGQEVAALDLEPHDQRLDAILTETGYTRFRKD